LALIEEIVTYVKTKEAPFNFETLNPKEIIDQIHKEFETTIANRQITWSEPEEIPQVKADRLALIRVFRNLVDNALKYGGPDLSEIKIGYEESDDFHIFPISDDGQGIDEGNLEKIFGVFQRCQTQESPEGTGLGLAIVKEIAEKHGGTARAECRFGKGVTFYISISKSLKNRLNLVT
jgi:light-regulated signal transduction histidine kinase (bacteriophytochrome)